MIKVELTVAGLYYTQAIEIEVGQTVLDLMLKANATTRLTYQLEDGSTNNIDASMGIIQNNLANEITTRSGEKRSKGVYNIIELDQSPRKEAWQYYIERPLPGDPNFRKLVSRTVPPPPGGGNSFKTPGKSELLEDGDFVIWRCVSILLRPNGPVIAANIPVV